MLIDGQILISGDTRFDPELFDDFDMANPQFIFHDCQLFNPGGVHATYDELNTLPENIKSKMLLYHYGDSFDQFNPENDGFLGFSQAGHIYQVED